MTGTVRALWGAARYEFHMQLVRRSLWLVVALVGMVLLGLAISVRVEGMPALLGFPAGTRVLRVVIQWTMVVNYACPIAVGVMVADRVPRDRWLRTDELIAATPTPVWAHLGGKYLGATLATLCPVAVLDAAGTAMIVAHAGDPGALLAALAAFGAIVLPGTLFVSAWSLACPAVLWVPLYQFLFVGYWGWGNLIAYDTGVPTISGTLLTPVGSYMCRGLFGADVARSCPPVRLPATPATAAASAALLLVLAALAIALLTATVRWRRAHT